MIWNHVTLERCWAAEIGGKTPLDAALTELGARQAEEVMARIVYGLPA